MSTLRIVRHTLTRSPARAPLIWWRHRGLRDQDVMIASYPRSGSTWLRFMLYELFAGEPSGFEAVNRSLPEVGGQSRAPGWLPGSGRLIKTHESFRDEYARAVYLVRDVRSVVLSEYAYQRWVGITRASFGEFFERFLEGRVNGYGSWRSHVASWADAAEGEPRTILLTRFEDLRRDTPSVLGRIVGFLGGGQIPDQIDHVVRAHSLDAMREKEARAKNRRPHRFGEGKGFIGRGAVAGWRSELTEDRTRRLELWSGDQLRRMGYDLIT